MPRGPESPTAQLPHASDQEQRDEAGDDGNDEHVPKRHPRGEERERHERPYDSAHRVEGAVVAEARADELRHARVADERIARRRSERLPQLVTKPGDEHPIPDRGGSEHRTRSRRDPVAADDPGSPAPAHTV